MPRVPRHLVELAVGVWILIDLQRVWAPSLITIFGQAASTPAWLMGLFALAVVASPAVLLSGVRRTAAERHAVWAAWCLVGALLARLVVQVAPGGQLQLWAASAGLVLALTWLCLGMRHRGHDLLAGAFVGLAVATATHAALGTWGAVWRGDPWGWGLLAVQVGLVGWVFVRAKDAVASAGPAPRALGFWLMPALLVAGIAFANVGRGSADLGAPGAAVVAGGVVAAAGVVCLRPRIPAPVAVLGLLVMVGAAWFVLTAEHLAGASVVGAFAMVALAATLLVLAQAPVGVEVSRRDPTSYAWAGGLVWVIVLFVYYAGYDLGYRADWLIVVLVGVLGVMAVVMARRPVIAPVGGRQRPREAVAVGLVVAAAFGVSWVAPSVTVRPVEIRQVDRDPGLTVMAWNLRMGYGIDGRFRPREVAELIAEEAPDVVLLSEVDRGWLLNGGQDQLEILARLLDMDAHFGAAADPVWGDAILTRLPVERVVTQPLPSFGAVTGAQIMAATVMEGGIPYDVLSTHLQPAGHGPDGGRLLQAERIADFVRERSRPGVPMLLGGDFNIVPGSESFQTILDADLDDALIDSRPLFTSPADAPEEQIDHVFVSRGTWVNAAWAVSTELSDHFPVLVTIAAPPVV